MWMLYMLTLRRSSFSHVIKNGTKMHVLCVAGFSFNDKLMFIFRVQMPEIIQSWLEKELWTEKMSKEREEGNRDDKNIKIIFFICISRYALFFYLLIYFYMHERTRRLMMKGKKIKHKYKERLVASIKLNVITSFNVIFEKILVQKNIFIVRWWKR